MTAPKESPRVYRSPLRQEQAQRTRLAVLDAASRQFVAKGFGVTTMKDIAVDAGVSVESVYAQGSKSALLLACVDRSIVGDDEPVPLLERDDMRGLLASADVRERLAMLRTVTIDRLPASAPIFEAFRGAAVIDAKLAAEWKLYEERRYADCARMTEGLAGHLRPGLTVSAATDVLWTIVSPSTIHMFVRERGWSPEQFADWMVDAIERLLLRDP